MWGRCGERSRLHLGVSRSGLERPAREGESPVGEASGCGWCRYPSRPGFEEPWSKLGGPPSKAKYEPATDSARVP